MEDIIPLCPICLLSLGELDDPVRLKNCGHSYHLECVSSWLPKHSQCPDCRKPATKDDIQKDFVMLKIIEDLKKLNLKFSSQTPGAPAPTTTTATVTPPTTYAPSTVPSYTTAASYSPPRPSAQVQLVSSSSSSSAPSIGVGVGNYGAGIGTRTVTPTSSAPPAPSSSSASSSSSNISAASSVARAGNENCLSYHAHPLTLSVAKLVYPPSGKWFCDICGGGPPDTAPMYHCQRCGNFDLCESCVNKGKTTTHAVYSCHAHPLVLSDAKVVYGKFGGKWHCNVCRKNNQTIMYHCYYCSDFDACEQCRGV